MPEKLIHKIEDSIAFLKSINILKNKYNIIIYLLLLGLTAFILMYWITAQGIGVSPDSCTYLETAKNLISGNGLSVNNEPMTHFPPLYPITLMISTLFNSNILFSARFLHSILYALNIILFSTYVYFATERKRTAGIVAFAIFFSSMFILSLHAMAWSEPLFITLIFIAFICHSKYLETEKKIMFWVSSLSIALAIITRYLGVTLLPPVIISIFLFTNKPLKHKISDSIIMLSVALFPISIWIIRNLSIAQTATDRTLNMHLIGIKHYNAFIHTLNMLILPASIAEWRKDIILIVIIILLITSIITLWVKKYFYTNTFSNQLILPFISIFFSFEYLIVILISLSFFDANTPLDTRILLPMFLFLTGTTIALAWFVSKCLKKPFIWKYFLIVTYAFIVLNALDAAAEAIDTHYNGKRFNSLTWRQSPILNLVQHFDKKVIIYSNEPTLIRFQTGQDSYTLPTYMDPCTHQINLNYKKELLQILHKCRNGTAVIIFFKKIMWKQYMISNHEIKFNLGLRNAFETEHTVLYGNIVVKLNK